MDEDSSTEASDSLDSIASSSLGAAETKAKPGRIGIPNIGNSCFINAAIQCLSNTRLVRVLFVIVVMHCVMVMIDVHRLLKVDFFTSSAYKNELNLNNPLGTRGQVGLLFAEFLDRLWTTVHSLAETTETNSSASLPSYPAVDLAFVKRFKESFAQFAVQVSPPFARISDLTIGSVCR